MTRLSLRDRVTVARNVLFRDLEGEAVLLNLASGTYFGLDPVGTRIWHLLRERGRLLDVRDAIVREYDVTVDAITRDLLCFVGDLTVHGLVERA